MRIRAFYRGFLLSAALALASCHAKSAPGADRIIGAIDSAQVTTLSGSKSLRARPANDSGRADPAMPLPALSLNFQLSAAQQAALDQLLADQQNPRSPLFRKWITPQEFGARFGLSPHDIDAVTAWLQAEGFQLQRVSNSRTRVFFSGTAGQVERVFRTEIHRYGDHFANATDVSVPKALAGLGLHVGGLNDFVPHSSARGTRHAMPTPGYTTGSSHHYMVPADLATIYDAAALFSQEPVLDGTGVSIAVIGASACTESNIASFRSLSGLPAVSYASYLVPNSGGSTYVNDNDNGETYLDVEWVGALAPKAAINYVYTGGGSGYGAFDALEYAADHPADVGNPTIISASYKGCESGEGSGYSSTLRGYVQEAATGGITVLACAGDSGAAGCDEQAEADTASGGLGVEIPSSFPEAVAAGGTEFNENGGSYWSSSNAGNYGSATGYIPETSWNDTGPGVGLASGGGGLSIFYGKPSWQTALTPNDNARDVPDISLSASWDHDSYMICFPDISGNTTVQYCASDWGWDATDGYFWSEGGTSAVAPSLAGVVALLNQSLGTGLGNINPTLYQLAASQPSVFHDITTGNNIVPCASSSPNCGCPSGTPGCTNASPDQYGYSAGTGYDYVTGLGSIDVYNLWTYWPTQTTTSLSAQHAGFPAGGSDMLTATISTTRIGPALTGDSVQFYVGSTLLGSSIVTVGSGSTVGATATFAMTASTPAVDQVTAVFVGDNTYLTSTSNAVTITIDPALVLTPPSQTVLIRATINFQISGGDGSYVWTIDSQSGGSLANGCTTSCLYTAGTTGGTQDVVTVTDGDGNPVSATVTVNGTLKVTPSSPVEVPPRGTVDFMATGANGALQWALTTNHSGGNVSSSGVYVAGSTPDVSDVVTVTDETQQSKAITLHVGAGVSVSPAAQTVTLGQSVTFSASGGSGTGFHWSFAGGPSASGGTLDAQSGAYVAGLNAPATDTIQATDSLGNIGTTTVNVIAGSGSPAAGGCGCGTGGADTAPGLMLLMIWQVQRRRARPTPRRYEAPAGQ